MSDVIASEKPDLSKFGNVVPEGYDYYEKIITPGEDLVLPGAYLKWYDLYPDEDPITETQSADTRAFLASEVEAGRLKLQDELGFVILHRAGSVLLLLLTTWRNTNEMWESVWWKPAEGEGRYKTVPADGNHRGTFCVWELGAVWHERDAWVLFLSSKRDVQAKQDYIGSKFTGRV